MMGTAYPVRYTALRRPWLEDVTGERDELNNTVSGHGPGETLPVIFAAPGATSDFLTPGRDVSRVQWTLGIPPHFEVKARDLIVWQGYEYEVNGDAQDYTWGPWETDAQGLIVELVRADG